MFEEIKELRALLLKVLENQEAMKPQRKPYTRHEFAAAINRSYTTVCRLIGNRTIRTVQGRIPASELAKFQP